MTKTVNATPLLLIIFHYISLNTENSTSKRLLQLLAVLVSLLHVSSTHTLYVVVYITLHLTDDITKS